MGGRAVGQRQSLLYGLDDDEPPSSQEVELGRQAAAAEARAAATAAAQRADLKRWHRQHGHAMQAPAGHAAQGKVR